MTKEKLPGFVLRSSTAQKMKFSIKGFFSKTFSEILNGKLHFLCSEGQLDSLIGSKKIVRIVHLMIYFYFSEI